MIDCVVCRTRVALGDSDDDIVVVVVDESSEKLAVGGENGVAFEVPLYMSCTFIRLPVRIARSRRVLCSAHGVVSGRACLRPKATASS